MILSFLRQSLSLIFTFQKGAMEKRAGIMRPWTCRLKEREGKRRVINKWGAAGLERVSKVRGTFTPVPQGCRAAKAQLEIRSGERCPWQCSGGLAGLQMGRRGRLACPKQPPAGCAHTTEKNTNSGVIEACSHAVFIQHLYYSSQTDCYTVRFTHASPAYIEKQAHTQLNMPMSKSIRTG